jgi:hypothetical protein
LLQIKTEAFTSVHPTLLLELDSSSALLGFRLVGIATGSRFGSPYTRQTSLRRSNPCRAQTIVSLAHSLKTKKSISGFFCFSLAWRDSF